MSSNEKLIAVLQQHQANFHLVVPFDAGQDRFYLFDFTEKNTAITEAEISDTDRLAAYINDQIKTHDCRYGIGGYGEHRMLYSRSHHFDANLSAGPASEQEEKAEPRRLHLGTDIWGPVGTKVMSPLDGIVHSFAFNNHDSDYGCTIILSHNIEGTSFHTLYGHLSLNSIKNLQEGKRILRGETFAEFGMRFENGNWPPHLHMQIIKEMGEWQSGDYPGVCAYSEREHWLANSPDPDLLLQFNRYII